MNKTLITRITLPLIFLLLLIGCKQTSAPVAAQEITTGTSCSLDGMTLADFPGPKAQIHYATGEPDFFCDTMEMFSIYLQPEQKKNITGIYTQDMGKANWEKPQGSWIDAKTAFYVFGSKKTGSMGPTLAAFASQDNANKFAAEFGGKVLNFSQVTPEIVDLTGGVIHDEHM
ncbi:MAG: nitrous oxide reductase accessory protein NosL [Methylotenera sp.]|nr:nitrous oxide reductase accessory protein NosL [Methylotenera sp.]